MGKDRAGLVRSALDHALETVAGVAKLDGRAPTIDDARLAVKATDMACGPAARAADAWLLAAGVEGIRFHSLTGHYVLRDDATGLLHDIEKPQGCASKEDLPIWRRSVELAELSSAGGHTEADRDAVMEAHARAWMESRTASIASAHG